MAFAAPALWSAVALLMGKSTLKAIASPTSICCFTALAAQPSTGKSKAMAIVQHAIDKIERFNGVLDNNSQQVNAPTIEGLLELLTRLPELIGLSLKISLPYKILSNIIYYKLFTTKVRPSWLLWVDITVAIAHTTALFIYNFGRHLSTSSVISKVFGASL